MIKLKSLLNENLRSESDEYYYHVTLAPYVPLIQKRGLKIKGNKPTVSNYKEYSKGKIFLTDVGALDWWIHTIASHGFDQHDDEKYHDVAVFRILKSNLHNVQVDKDGSNDSRGNCFYVIQDIPPQSLEFVKIEKSPY